MGTTAPPAVARLAGRRLLLLLLLLLLLARQPWPPLIQCWLARRFALPLWHIPVPCRGMRPLGRQGSAAAVAQRSRGNRQPCGGGHQVRVQAAMHLWVHLFVLHLSACCGSAHLAADDAVL